MKDEFRPGSGWNSHPVQGLAPDLKEWDSLLSILCTPAQSLTCLRGPISPSESQHPTLTAAFMVPNWSRSLGTGSGWPAGGILALWLVPRIACCGPCWRGAVWGEWPGPPAGARRAHLLVQGPAWAAGGAGGLLGGYLLRTIWAQSLGPMCRTRLVQCLLLCLSEW